MDNHFKKIRSKRFKPENKKNIFVCLGGFAADKALLKICNALIENKPFIKKIFIITGYNSKLDIKNIFSNHNIDFTIFDYCKDILKYLSLSNLAIISGGHIKYEAAALGIPSVIISIVKHQETLSSIFEKTNSSIHLGNYKKLNSKSLSKNIHNILLNNDKLKKMSEAGLKSIDGRGSKRVIENILDFNPSK